MLPICLYSENDSGTIYIFQRIYEVILVTIVSAGRQAQYWLQIRVSIQICFRWSRDIYLQDPYLHVHNKADVKWNHVPLKTIDYNFIFMGLS